MSADLLRRASALMRMVAEGSTQGPWAPDRYGSGWQVNGAGTVFADAHALRNDATHVASWHPAVALAVAQWLDNIAHNWDHVGGGCQADAEDVARAYLGADA